MPLDLGKLAIALSILTATYVLVVYDRYDRSAIALLGGAAMVAAGVLSPAAAAAAVDLNTIGLLTGMMLLVGIARRSGLFEFLAASAVRAARASPPGLLAALALATAVLSALLDNVTTVLLVAPVTLAVCRRLSLPPFGFLAVEVMASNLGGTATLIGDPPNILIGSAAGLSFNDFLVHMLPAAALAVAAQIAAAHAVFGRRLRTDPAARAAALAVDPAAEIRDPALLRRSTAVFALAITGFCTSRLTHLEAGTVALGAAAILLLLDNRGRAREEQHGAVAAAYAEVDWITIFFFAGLFVVVRGVESTGAMEWLAHRIAAATGGDQALAMSAILWSAAILSAVIDNIPFVAAAIPVIHALGPAMGGDGGLLPLWVALSLGACFGGNATLVGASANLAAAGIAQRAGIPFGFARYTRAAAPATLLAVAIAHAYLLLRYL